MKKHLLLILLIIFNYIFCADRIFDNPIDPNKEEYGYSIISTIPTGSIIPVDMSFTGDSIWVVSQDGKIYSLNYNSGQIIRVLNYEYQAIGITYDGDEFYINNKNRNLITKVNTVSGSIIQNLYLGEGDFENIDYFNDVIYISERNTNSIYVLDSNTAQVISMVSNRGFSIDGVCYDGEFLWTVDSTTSKIYKISLSGELINQYKAPDKYPCSICYYNQTFWIGDRSGKIFRIEIK